jgi:hypothetical protein
VTRAEGAPSAGAPSVLSLCQAATGTGSGRTSTVSTTSKMSVAGMSARAAFVLKGNTFFVLHDDPAYVLRARTAIARRLELAT